MKKHLLSTSAIALGVAMAVPATAQEWDVSIGGYMNQHVAYRDLSGNGLLNPGGYDGVDFHSDTEIHFNPTITLDNGLTFGAHVQLEGENQGNSQIDESYMTISSDTLGQIVVGSTNSAGYKLMVGAPELTTMYINSPSISTFIPFSLAYQGGFRQAGLSSYTEVAGNDDVQRLTYFTPSFNGLTVGVSYAPTGRINVANNYGNPPNAVVHDIFDFGANYSQTFGTTSITLAARYGTAEAPTDIPGMSDPSTWGLGAQITFADFTVGGGYAENDNGFSGPGNSSGWSLGATYDMAGPWAFEALTYQGKSKNIDNSNGEYQAYKVGASRDLGPGVDWDIYVAYVDSDSGYGNFFDGAGNPTNRLNVKGTIIGTGINLSF